MGVKRESADRNIDLVFPSTGYKKTLFFNKFAIEDAEVGLFLGFWCLNKAGYVADEFGCFVSKVDAVRFVATLKQYIAKLNILPTDCADGVMSGTCLKNAPVVRHIRCARVGDVGELDLSFYPLSAVVGQKPTVDKVDVEPVAALISSQQAHVNFVCRFLQCLEVKK